MVPYITHRMFSATFRCIITVSALSPARMGFSLWDSAMRSDRLQKCCRCSSSHSCCLIRAVAVLFRHLTRHVSATILNPSSWQKTMSFVVKKSLRRRRASNSTVDNGIASLDATSKNNDNIRGQITKARGSELTGAISNRSWLFYRRLLL